jgi:protein-disulfide isomerase
MIRLEHPVGDDDHIRGNPHAPVTLVEYGDFECVYCADAHPIVKEVMRRFPRSVRFVFRHAPQARLHPNAQLAAEAAEAAGAQGRFWEFHDALFESRELIDWTRLQREAFRLGLDLERFTRDIEEHRHLEIVTRLERSGTHTVRGTPTFFLDGERYEDSSDADTFSAAIDRRLHAPASTFHFLGARWA